MLAGYRRDHETARAVAGVRTNPEHWASAVVHAFRCWKSDSVLQTWCDLEVDVSQRGRQTTDLIDCLQCGQGSWRGFQGERQRL
jgi:hypothetical protein